jgi:hypothetical protein
VRARPHTDHLSPRTGLAWPALLSAHGFGRS